MPFLRGVDIAIAVQPGFKELPEFPHPDASSVRILPVAPRTVIGNSQNSSSASPGSGSCSPRIQKTNPAVSVYIPSIPGAQFCLRYAVTRSPEPPCHLFFKVSMNGRNVTSWGINPAVHASGSVTRALYEPCDKWHYKEAGVVLKRQGIESRCFHFAPTSNSVPVAEDGGLIEIFVFRAKGRRPRAPLLTTFRGQEQYGIASPSTGLLECPEETLYYDWILVDPKDSPFASFRFHYRSWDNLRLLNLGSDEVYLPRRETRPSSLKGWNIEAPATMSNEWRLDGEVFDEHSSVRRRDRTRGGTEDAISYVDSPSMALQAVPNLQTQDVKLNEMHHYDYPEPSARDATIVPRKSTDSSAPSVAPSLLQYVEEGSTGTEDIEYGMATEVPVHWDPLHGVWGKRPLPQLPRRNSSSSSLYGRSPPSSLDSSPSHHQKNQAHGDDHDLSEEVSASRCEVRSARLGLEALVIGEGEWMKGDSASKGTAAPNETNSCSS